jgi:hypothetical protein
MSFHGSGNWFHDASFFLSFGPLRCGFSPGKGFDALHSGQTACTPPPVALIFVVAPHGHLGPLSRAGIAGLTGIFPRRGGCGRLIFMAD